MKLAVFSNYLNHHQIPLADALYSLNDVEYTFVSIMGMPDFRKELGYKEITKPYLLDTTLSEDNKQKAKKIAVDADVAIFITNRMEEYEIPRLKTGKLTFECSERWFKKKYFVNILSPKLWKHQLMYYLYGRNANLHMLCASAYAANDYYLLRSFKNRCYKWAYFTQVNDINIEEIIHSKAQLKIRLMWCGRFIDWKHPELAIELAKRLKNKGYDFELDMYGNGPLLNSINKSIKDNQLTDCVFLKGNVFNEEIIKAMQSHHIFLFTSDQNEGWGAVANEAMSNGCTLVASDSIGSVPFLVHDGENGLIFRTECSESLLSKVESLFENRYLIDIFAKQAYIDMKNVWSPQNAAVSLLSLISDLNLGKGCSILNGPCSKAEPIKKRNYGTN